MGATDSSEVEMASKKKVAEQPAATEQQEQTATATAEVQKQPHQNGITRPRGGTSTGRVWELSDELSAKAGKAAARGDVMKAGEAEGLNAATIATQYGRWRKFHGLGRYAATEGAAAQEPADAGDAPEVLEDDEEGEED